MKEIKIHGLTIKGYCLGPGLFQLKKNRHITGYSFVSVWKVLRVVHFEGFPKNNDTSNNMSILHGHIAGSRF